MTSNYMPIKSTTWKKWIDAKKSSTFQVYQEELEIMSKPIINTEIETVIKICQNKSPEPDGFTGEFYQVFREELMPILLKLFKKLQREQYFQIHSVGQQSS